MWALSTLRSEWVERLRVGEVILATWGESVDPAVPALALGVDEALVARGLTLAQGLEGLETPEETAAIWGALVSPEGRFGPVEAAHRLVLWRAAGRFFLEATRDPGLRTSHREPGQPQRPFSSFHPLVRHFLQEAVPRHGTGRYPQQEALRKKLSRAVAAAYVEREIGLARCLSLAEAHLVAVWALDPPRRARVVELARGESGPISPARLRALLRSLPPETP